MKHLKPLAGYCLIEPLDEQDQKTSSGLVLPEKAKEKPEKGKIIAVGYTTEVVEDLISQCTFDDAMKIEPPVKKGDIVIFHRWSGQDVKEGDKEYKLVKFSDIMGKYE